MRWRTAPCECEGYSFIGGRPPHLFKQIEHPSTVRFTTLPVPRDRTVYYRCTPNASKDEAHVHVSDGQPLALPVTVSQPVSREPVARAYP